jgi:hypothetical protein
MHDDDANLTLACQGWVVFAFYTRIARQIVVATNYSLLAASACQTANQ